MANHIISYSELNLLLIYERCHYHLLNSTITMEDESRLPVMNG